MKIALLQMDVKWESPADNLSRAGRIIAEARAAEADLVVLPEMSTTGFTMDLKAVGREENARAHPALSAMASEHGINIVAGYADIGPGEVRGRNLAAAYDRRGQQVALYTKVHPFQLLEEGKHYIAGDGPVVFPLDGVPTSVFICYDLRFPELMRKVARDAHLMLFLANWPSSRAAHWEALLKARAIENQCFVAGVNRVGTDGNGISYSGGSLAYGPMGVLIARGGDREEIVLCEIDPADVRRVRAEFPFLEDMRV